MFMTVQYLHLKVKKKQPQQPISHFIRSLSSFVISTKYFGFETLKGNADKPARNHDTYIFKTNLGLGNIEVR